MLNVSIHRTHMPTHVHTLAVLVAICSKMVTDAIGETMEADGTILFQLGSEG